MRQSKPMAREVLVRLVKWLEGSTTMTTTGRWNTEFWQEALALDLITHHSFSQAFALAVKMLLPAPWAYERRKGKNGWEYRFWREEPATVIPTPAGPEIQEEPVKLTPEIRNETVKTEVIYRATCGCQVLSNGYPEYCEKHGIPNPPSATTTTDAFEVVSKQNEALTEENASLRAQLAERPACPEDFIHKAAVRKRLIDMLLDPGAALDSTLLKYVRELED